MADAQDTRRAKKVGKGAVSKGVRSRGAGAKDSQGSPRASESSTKSQVNIHMSGPIDTLATTPALRGGSPR